MSNSRPDIPLPIARQLRQESGFGCCRCGTPIVQYHHIVPYHADDPYPPHEMMTLCPICHDMATKHAIPVDEQWEMKAAPHNIRHGFTQGTLHVNQRYCAIQVGENLLVSDRAVVSIDDEPLLSVSMGDGGQLLLSLTLYDADNALLALIENNEWISGDPLPWDIESDYQYLRVRRKLGDIAIEIHAQVEPMTLRAELWRNGALIRLTPDSIVFGQKVQSSAIHDLGLVGMELVLRTGQPQTITIEPHPQYGSGMLVSQDDPYVRLRESVLAWRRMRDPDSVPGPNPSGRRITIGRNDPCWCGSGKKLKRCHTH